MAGGGGAGPRLLTNELPRTAQSQAGVFTAQQAVQEGWTYARVRRRLASGLWAPVVGKGIAVAGERFSGQQVGWAVHLSVPSATVSHLSAAAVHGFPVAAGLPDGHVIAQMHRAPTGILVHRDRLTKAEREWIGGVPVTSRRRTAIDCLALLDWDAAVGLWAWLLSRGVLTADQLAAAVRQRVGRRGVTTLVRLLELARTGAASVAEQRLHRLLRGAGLAGWRANVPIHDGAGLIAVADVLFAEARLVIEVDGFAAHQAGIGSC